MAPDSIDDCRPIINETKHGPERNVWWCTNGSAGVTATKTVEHLAKEPLYGSRVAAIQLETNPKESNDCCGTYHKPIDPKPAALLSR